MLPVVVACILLYAIIDGVSAGVVAEQRVVFAFVLVSVLAGVFALPKRSFVSPFSMRLGTLWAIVIALGFLGVPRQPIIYPTYVMGDAAAIALPLLMIVYGRGDARLFSGRVIRWMVISSFAIACCSLLFADDAGRYEPPTPLLMAALWVWATFPGPLSRRLAAGAGLVVVAALALGSGFRTHAILVVLGGAATLLLRAYSGRRVALLVGFLVALTLLAVLSGLHLAVYSILLDTRFGPMLLYGLDHSSVNRFFEVQDAAHVMSTRWDIWHYVAGEGHGATYEPSFSYSDRNLTADNRIHNIHIGPALLVFRYGLLGAALWLGLLAAVVRAFRYTRDNLAVLPDAEARSVFAVAGLLVLVEFLQFNSIVNPLSAFAIAGSIAWSYRHLEARASPSRGSDRSAGPI